MGIGKNTEIDKAYNIIHPACVSLGISEDEAYSLLNELLSSCQSCGINGANAGTALRRVLLSIADK